MAPFILTLSDRQLYAFLYEFRFVSSAPVNFQPKYNDRSFFKKQRCPFTRLNLLDSSPTFLMYSHKYNSDYLLTPWNRVLLEKLTVNFAGPCQHGMACPQVADGGTASYMEGSYE
jgi:hypothetical protein